jgi:GNAT superfamily N-acetyltransferase
MQILIREIDKADPEELRIVSNRCMSAVLETIPEFEGREYLAQSVLRNFSYQQMADMIQNDFDDPSKRIMVAIAEARVVGQSIYSIKQDADGKLYGFCFSRYIEQEHRRRGVATALLQDCIEWFKKNNAAYIIAHTHVTNIALQNLFATFGFRMEGPIDGPWQYFLLRKDL